VDLLPDLEQQDPEQENRTPAIKSTGFSDTAPSTKSKNAAAMTSIAAIMRAVALGLSVRVSVIGLTKWPR